jgi:serine/threonine protein kinase
VAKLADFGLTQSLADADCGKINERLPVYWLSPESLNYKRFTTKSDVWSYGVLLWEMVTYGEFPYGNCDLKRMLYLAKKELLGLKPPSDCCKALKLAISRCQANDPRKRPTFTEIENLISAHFQLLATGTICATSQM